jgi:hypothetical protein
LKRSCETFLSGTKKPCRRSMNALPDWRLWWHKKWWTRNCVTDPDWQWRALRISKPYNVTL